uniref:Uncharacterized protein n=1 Tax=Pararge aegeria TaxID=116150 RepID=S4PBJ1_9NEOP
MVDLHLTLLTPFNEPIQAICRELDITEKHNLICAFRIYFNVRLTAFIYLTMVGKIPYTMPIILHISYLTHSFSDESQNWRFDRLFVTLKI